jgi:hypothetical protein
MLMSPFPPTGMQVFVFIASKLSYPQSLLLSRMAERFFSSRSSAFALFGAGNGESVSFPGWALNPQSGNADYCFDTNAV